MHAFIADVAAALPRVVLESVSSYTLSVSRLFRAVAAEAWATTSFVKVSNIGNPQRLTHCLAQIRSVQLLGQMSEFG